MGRGQTQHTDRKRCIPAPATVTVTGHSLKKHGVSHLSQTVRHRLTRRQNDPMLWPGCGAAGQSPGPVTRGQRQCQLTRQSAGQPPGRLHTAEEEERQKLQGAGLRASLTAHWCRSHSGDTGSTPGSGRSPGEGNGYPLRYSCWDNPMDRGAWWAYSLWGHKESDTTEHTCTLE